MSALLLTVIAVLAALAVARELAILFTLDR